MKKKVLSMFLASAMALSVVACGSSNGGADTTASNETTPAQETKEETAAAETTAEPATSSELTDGKFAETRKITVEIYDRGNDGGSDPENNMYTEYIKKGMLEEHNVEVTFKKVPRWTEVDDINNLLAAGEAPDICVTYSYPTVLTYAQMGGVIDLSEMIETYKGDLPNLWGWLGETNMLWDKDPKTGTVWAIEGKRAEQQRIVTFVRQDWLDKLGLEAPKTTQEFEDKYTYEGDDLGATVSADKTEFRLWAPTAESVSVNLYETGDPWKKDLIETVQMTADEKGTWVAEVSGNLAGTYYTYTAVLDGLNVEACDPYARTTGVNGKRAMVIDLDSTDPDGWADDKNPHASENINDAVIYELHIRDFSVDENGNMANVGKYTAFTETGTKTAGGNPTGVDYIKSLGVTHIHLLPFYDFGSVDENDETSERFNWGYDPVNYNVPEGSYSTDAHDGNVRVKETKEMVKALHDNGLSVVMDVVYNHVYSGKDFCINRLVPGYFSRINPDGTYSNGSGCGNDTASERSMVRKYIVDSVCYWADEYHIDGFRFDLVGLLDVDTINEIVTKVHETHPDVIFYGEGWSMSTDVTKENVVMATQQSSEKTPDFAYFNDNIRDGLKGSVFNTSEVGWASGTRNAERAMTASFLANETWSKNPSQIIQYASCHDNNTLYDRIAGSRTDLDEESWIKMSNLAASFYLTAEGVPFMQAGEEILRTKVKEDGSFDSNSYSSGDEVNCIKWENLDDPGYQKNLEFYKGLITFRKEHALLRLSSAEDVASRVKAVEGLDKNVLAFVMDNSDKALEGESAEQIFLAFNPNETKAVVDLPEGNWNVYVKGEQAGTEVIETVSGSVTVEPISSVVLVKGDAGKAGVDKVGADKAGAKNKAVVPIIVAITGVAAITVALFLKNKKKK